MWPSKCGDIRALRPSSQRIVSVNEVQSTQPIDLLQSNFNRATPIVLRADASLPLERAQAHFSGSFMIFLSKWVAIAIVRASEAKQASNALWTNWGCSCLVLPISFCEWVDSDIERASSSLVQVNFQGSSASLACSTNQSHSKELTIRSYDLVLTWPKLAT